MYTKLQQSNIKYSPNTDLKDVIINHQANIRLIKFGRLPSVITKRGECVVKNLADVIIGWASGERTVFVDDGTIQCAANRIRSDLDLFLLCRYYFSMSYDEFSKVFTRFKNMKRNTPYGGTNVLEVGYCSTIRRRVYYNIDSLSKIEVKSAFSNVKLKINKTPNIGETL